MKFWIYLFLEILVVVLLFNACFPKEYKAKHPAFVYGSITDEGYYDFEAKNSICTKNAIKCTKFRIKRDFDAEYSVKIFFYNSDDVLVDIKEMEKTELEIDYTTMPEGATAIRIVLSNNTGFSDWDRFRFRWFDLGLTASTKKASESFDIVKVFTEWWNPIFGSNNDNVFEVEDPTVDFPDMISPGDGSSGIL